MPYYPHSAFFPILENTYFPIDPADISLEADSAKPMTEFGYADVVGYPPIGA